MKSILNIVAAIGLLASAVPASAQVRTVDPNSAIDADLSPRTAPPSQQQPLPDPYVPPADAPLPPAPPPPATSSPDDLASRATAAEAAPRYQRDDILAAAESTFGKGTEGLAGLVEKLLKEQGEPDAYIAGREVGGALFIGLRYGSGVMTHRIEGERKVYWTGPSVGFDVGGDANKVFVLVYNLVDTQELFHRFPAVEGRVYFVGGFAATYMRRGNTVLIPIRLGVGWRLGANVGYMNFTEKSRLLPF